MSYLENGETLRSAFRLMGPTKHDIDPAKSEVINNIRRAMDYGEVDAVRAFNSMRNVKSGVLVFDRIHRIWRGCDWVPSDEEARKDFVLGQLSQLRRDMNRELAEIRKELNELRYTRSRRKKEADIQPQTEEPDANIESYSVELKNGPLTIYRDDGEPDNEWQRRKDHVLNQRVMFLNISGKSGTPEQEDYIKRMNFPPNKPPAKQANSSGTLITQAWS